MAQTPEDPGLRPHRASAEKLAATVGEQGTFDVLVLKESVHQVTSR